MSVMQTLARAVAAGALVAGASAALAPARAQFDPVANARTASGFYFEASGAYHSVRLPAFDLGWRYAVFTTAADLGPAISTDVRVSGEGASGRVGYVLPPGALQPAFGANARIELGWSYIHADSNQSGSSNAFAFNTSNVGFRLASVDGSLLTGIGCNPACYAQSTLESKYEALHFNLKAAGDLRSGPLTVTPWAAVIGGFTGSHQTLAVQMVFNPPVDQYRYSATVDIDWRDLGGKVGLDGTLAVTPWLAFGLGGSVGTVHRSVVLQANDLINYTPMASYRGKTEDRETIAPFLANAEARLAIQAWQTMAIKAFVGLNYDSRVPGIAPSCPANSCVGGSFVGPPASIKFESTTSYYAGGGLVLKFDP